MLTRRQTVVGAAAGAALPTLSTLVACAPNASHANDKYAQQMRSSAGVAVFVSEANDKTHWRETGRSSQRGWALGLSA